MPTENLSLRPATLEDLLRVSEIEKKVHTLPWTEKSFQSELTKSESRFLVYTDDETDIQIAGYVVYHLVADQCHLLNVAVDLPFRGLGLAKKMLTQVVNDALRAGVDKVVLEVRKSNQAALQLYQLNKFNIVHLKRSFYSDGEDAYLMELLLKGSNELE